MNKRRIGLPLVFLWALTHGIWIGANWHAGGIANFSAGASTAHANCACQPGAASKNVQISNPVAAPAACSVCNLSLLSHDIPLHNQTPVLHAKVYCLAAVFFAAPVVARLCPLPPGRGPPV